MSGCLERAPEIEKPACRSSLIWLSLRAKMGRPALAASIVKTFNADTCASNKVDICRERITISFFGILSKKEVKSIDFFFSVSSIEIIIKPRRWSPLIAISRLGASICPSLLTPCSSTALYENNIVKLYHSFQSFRVKRILISILYGDLPRANKFYQRVI